MAGDQPAFGWNGTPNKNTGNGIGRLLGGKSAWRARRHDDIRLDANQLGRQICEAIVVPLRPSILDGDVLALDVAEFTELLTECVEDLALQGWRGGAEVTDPRSHSRLLRARRERPRGCRPAEQCDELAALHSITSSAVASSVVGIVRPSAFAVLRLMASSNLLGSWIGSSPGLLPLRMRSTYPAAKRNNSVNSTP